MLTWIFNRLLALILLIFALPFILFSIIVVKLTTNDPVFFCQKRRGRSGKIFTIFKIRTMFLSAPANVSKVELAKREELVTPVGKFLRGMNFDELPQLMNILLGQMNFVGPRPVPLSEEEVDWRRREKGIYQLKPGLTGLAAVVQKKGEREIIQAPQEQVEWDKAYLDNRSFWLDFKIIIATACLECSLGNRWIFHHLNLEKLNAEYEEI
jgi:lipopolysaccharide/colanic/teichoic acid biosynthesis glycosyltransferase